MEAEIEQFAHCARQRPDHAVRLLSRTRRRRAPSGVARRRAPSAISSSALPLARRHRRPAARALARSTRSSACWRASSSAPVASISSQTRSASAGPEISRRSSSPSSRERSRARISGSVTVPSSRSVPRRLPVRCLRPGDVEHVVEQLEARARRRGRTGRAAGPPPTSAPELARRGEQACGLQLAALEIALARDVGAPGVGALHQLAAGERRGRRRERRAAARSRRCARARRTRSRTAGRRSRSPRRGRPPRRPCAARAAAARRRARRRARASPSGSARPRPPRARPRRVASLPSPATKTSSGRSRLPPASTVASECSSIAVISRRRSLDVGHRRRAATRRRARGSRRTGPPRAEPPPRRARRPRRGHAHVTSPTWIAMIPPAVSTQRIRRSPQPCMTSASSRGPGKRRTELGR